MHRIRSTATAEAFVPALQAGVHKSKSDGIHVAFFESPGSAHEWPAWRQEVDDFAPRLFC